MSAETSPRLLDVTGAADYLSASEHFVRRLVRERRVSFVKIGRHVRFHAEDLDAFIAQGRREALASTRQEPARSRQEAKTAGAPVDCQSGRSCGLDSNVEHTGDASAARLQP